MSQFVTGIVDENAQVGGLARIEQTVGVVVVEHSRGAILHQVVVNRHVEVERTRLLAIDINRNRELDFLVGRHGISDREGESIGKGNRFVGGKVGAFGFTINDGNIHIFSCQGNRHIGYGGIGDILERHRHHDRFAWVEVMVTIARGVVKLVGFVFDGTQLDGLDSVKHIDTAKAVYIALAFGQRHGGFFKDAAHLGGSQVGVFAQHQSHATRSTRRSHRGATHGSVARVALVIDRLDVDTRGAHVGADEADARVVGIVAKLGVAPSDGAMRGEIGGVVVVVDGTDTHRAALLTRILVLHRIYIRRRAAAWHAHVVRDGELPLAVAFVTGSDGGHHTGIQGSLAGVAKQGALGDGGIGHAQRHTKHVATMPDGPLDTRRNGIGTATALRVQAFDTHQRGIGSHARLRSTVAIAANRTRTVRAVAMVVHGVIVVVINVVAVVREFRSAVPQVLGKVDMVVVDTRVDDGHHDALSRVAQIPHLVGTNLGDVRRDFARVRSGTSLFAIRDPVTFDGIANHVNVIALRKALDGSLVGLEAQGVGHPEDVRLGGHAVALHLGEGMTQVVL